MSTPETLDRPIDSARKRLAFMVFGYVFFVLGLAGTVLPVMPTTVFWVVAAICFARSSSRMYRRILAWPRIGPVVEDFVVDGVIKRRGKIIALCGMVVAAIIVAVASMDVIATIASLAGIAVGAIYVLSRPGRAANEIAR